MRFRETLSERNIRLRKLLVDIAADNKALRESDAAWAMTVHSLQARLRDLRFEDRKRRVLRRAKWWLRLYWRFRYWRERRRNYTAVD